VPDVQVVQALVFVFVMPKDSISIYKIIIIAFLAV